MFDKVKELGKGFMAAATVGATAGVLEYSDTVDWDGFGLYGPAAALIVGTGGQWFLGWFKKETRGYGAGVQKPSDQIPGGQPLPTGASSEQVVL